MEDLLKQILAALNLMAGRSNSAPASTIARVSESATAVTLLAANGKRVSGMIFNDSPNTLYIAYGATADATSVWSDKIGSGGRHYIQARDATNLISGFWSPGTGGGGAQVTENTY